MLFVIVSGKEADIVRIGMGRRMQGSGEQILNAHGDYAEASIVVTANTTLTQLEKGYDIVGRGERQKSLFYICYCLAAVFWLSIHVYS